MKKIQLISRCLGVICVLGLMMSAAVAAEKKESTLKVDKPKVNAWNTFADKLYDLHNTLISQHEVRTESERGGYAEQPDLYTETRYYDKKSNRLLSRVQRMNDNPDLVHLIEINIYDEKGNLARDYLAVYLPVHRNAPIQTLINLHNHQGELHGFRQFDASGARIYEQCEGKYQGKAVMISLEEHEFGHGRSRKSKVLKSDTYKQCFAGIPESAAAYLDPAKEIALLKKNSNESAADSVEQVTALVEQVSLALKQNPKDTALLIKRGDLYFQLREFEQAIADYSDAIELDSKADEAYFGRGMALGRFGQIREGIKDLSVYIERHPNDSRAYTKRGVRYLWIDEISNAEQDFTKAIALNPDNAEAHDDLGVIHARRGEYETALKHFNATVSIDPTYFKGFHNLSMLYFIIGQDALALASVEKALNLVPGERDSMLLKAEILQKLGRVTDATKVREEAEFLPEGNWSEHISVN